MLRSLKGVYEKLFRGLVSTHPDFADLVACRDGELSPARAASITRHVQECSECRVEADRVEQALDGAARALEDSAAVLPEREGLTNLLRIIRDDDLCAAEQERLRRERDSRIAAELRAYFGSYPELLLKTSPDEGLTFRVEISRLVQSFLGKAAASALLDRIDFEMGRA